jgi:hypothetical protein
MRHKIIKTAKPTIPSTEANHVSWAFVGVLVGVVWTAIGCGIALLQGESLRLFLHEWTNYQGPFLLALETWMLLMIRSMTFEARVAALTESKPVKIKVLGKPPVRRLIVASITILGFASVSRMGFNGRGAILFFMWFTNLVIDYASGLITLHALTIVAVVHNLNNQKIKVSLYAPARTLELRSVVKYFSTFTLLMSGCYIFALAGTLKGNWTGSKDYVEAVRWFWPIIYVPLCCAALIYPHLAIHKLIQRHKEDTLRSCQADIDKLLAQYPKLKNEDIGRTNELAQLFDRITATPNYVIDFGIAVRTLLPLALNLVTLFVKVSAAPR